jgi:hypothetical protein
MPIQYVTGAPDAMVVPPLLPLGVNGPGGSACVPPPSNGIPDAAVISVIAPLETVTVNLLPPLSSVTAPSSLTDATVPVLVLVSPLAKVIVRI